MRAEVRRPPLLRLRARRLLQPRAGGGAAALREAALAASGLGGPPPRCIEQSRGRLPARSADGVAVLAHHEHAAVVVERHDHHRARVAQVVTRDDVAAGLGCVIVIMIVVRRAIDVGCGVACGVVLAELLRAGAAISVALGRPPVSRAAVALAVQSAPI